MIVTSADTMACEGIGDVPRIIGLKFGFFYMIDMPRKARIDVPGALHHIIVRGIDRRKILFDDSDRNDFLDRLGGILPDSNAACLLNLFGWKIPEARRRYLVFVKKGGGEFGSEVCDPGSGLRLWMVDGSRDGLIRSHPQRDRDGRKAAKSGKG